MRGLKSDVMLALLDFLYLGKGNLWQEKLDEFLSLAADLKLKGLGGDEEQQTNCNSPNRKTSHIKSEKDNPISEAASSIETSLQTQSDTYPYQTSDVEMAQSEINEIRSMISSSDESLRNAGISGSGMVYTCKVCGKRGENSNIKRHVEDII